MLLRLLLLSLGLQVHRYTPAFPWQQKSWTHITMLARQVLLPGSHFSSPLLFSIITLPHSLSVSQIHYNSSKITENLFAYHQQPNSCLVCQNITYRLLLLSSVECEPYPEIMCAFPCPSKQASLCYVENELHSGTGSASSSDLSALLELSEMGVPLKEVPKEALFEIVSKFFESANMS